jgi:hypothetical protein
MIELLSTEFSRECHENSAAGAIVATECCLGRVDDLLALSLRLRPGAQGHGVHVRQKEEPICILECALARQIDNEIARFGRQRNAGARSAPLRLGAAKYLHHQLQKLLRIIRCALRSAAECFLFVFGCVRAGAD